MINTINLADKVLLKDLPYIDSAIRLVMQDGITKRVASEMVLERYDKGVRTIEMMAGVWQTYDLLKGFLK